MSKIHNYTISVTLPTEKVETLYKAAQEQLMCTQCQHVLVGRIFITSEYAGVTLHCSHCGLMEFDQS